MPGEERADFSVCLWSMGEELGSRLPPDTSATSAYPSKVVLAQEPRADPTRKLAADILPGKPWLSVSAVLLCVYVCAGVRACVHVQMFSIWRKLLYVSNSHPR